MLFSVLWLRTALAAGFVPSKQHGIFVMEKQHMLVCLFGWGFGGCFGVGCVFDFLI